MIEQHAPASPEHSPLPVSKWERFGYVLPWLVLVTCLAATVALWHAAKETSKRETQDYFDFRVREAVDKTEQRLTMYTEVLRGAQGLFKGSGDVSRNEFKAYVAALRLADSFPGIQGVGFSRVIPPAEKERHIAAIRKEGFPEYTIRPEGKRALYTSIIYIEPFAERNLRAFGYDMYSEPVRRAAMERARDTSEPALSGKVQLVQEASQNIQPGFLLYLPIYRNGVPHDTLAQRRASLVGWVYAPFRMADLMLGIYGERAPDLDIHIYDGATVSEESLMYDSSPHLGEGAVPRRYIANQQLELAGHIWTLNIASNPSFESRINAERPRLIAVGGVATSLLLTLIIWMLAHGRKRALQFARQINHDLIVGEQALRRSEERYRTLTESMKDVVWVLDTETLHFTYVSPSVTRLRGYTPEEVMAQPVDAALTSTSLDYVRANIEQQKNEFPHPTTMPTVYYTSEVEQPCKDGSTVWTEVITHFLYNERTGHVEVHGVSRDITERKRAEEKLERWAHIFEHAEWGITVGSADGKRIELMNPAFAKARGYTVEEMLQLPIAELFAPEERTALPEHIRLAHETGHHTFESRHLRKDGSVFPVLVDVTTVKDGQGKVLYRVVNVQDITRIKAVEKALQDSRAILQSILDNSPYMIWLKDTEGRFVGANQSFLDSTGRKDMGEILGKTDADLWPEHLAAKYRADDIEVIASRHQKMTEEQALDKGHMIWMETFKTPVFDASGNPLGVTGFARDVTERKLMEEKVLHLAQYDVLTELPNRVLFSDRLLHALTQAKRERKHLAVMFLDLDRFKPVNDMFGHDIGDILLREVAMRIESCVRQSDTVARIGGDEFCVLLPALENPQDASQVADKILHVLRQPFYPGGHTVYIASSIGISIYPQDGRDEQTLIKNADIAMYWAKEAGRDNMQFFRPEMRDSDMLNRNKPA